MKSNCSLLSVRIIHPSMLRQCFLIFILSLSYLQGTFATPDPHLRIYPLKHDDEISMLYSESDPTSNFSFNVFPVRNYTNFKSYLSTIRFSPNEEVADAAAILTISPPGGLPSTKIAVVISTPAPGTQQSLRTIIFYGFLGVTITNLCSLGGFICIPVSRHRLYHLVLTFMTSLAVGALVSTALLVLIPESMRMVEMPEEFGGQGRSYLWKMSFIIIGSLFFFALEYFLYILPRLLKWTSKANSLTDDTKVWCASSASLSTTTPIMSGDGDKLSKTSSNDGADKNGIKFSRKKFMRIAPVAWMILLGDGIHNLMDGLTIGAGFTNSPLVGITLSLSILFEELPHELGDFAILISSGFSVKAALISNFMSACSAYIGLAIGIAIGEVSSAALYVFAVTAGIFLYISLSDMLPTLRNEIQEAERKNGNSLPTFLIQLAGLIIGFSCVLTTTLCSDFINL